MIRNRDFEITKIADEYMAVPVGEEAISFHGVVTLSEPAAFVLKLLDEPQTKEGLVDQLLEEYEVDRASAEADLTAILQTFIELKLVLDA